MEHFKAVCAFSNYDEFVKSLNFCQVFDLDVLESYILTFDCILFYDELDFMLFLGFAHKFSIIWHLI